MFVTWAKHQHQARTFWTKVRDGGQLKVGAPEYRLREYLLRVVMNPGARSTFVSTREIYAKCVVAWNAFRRKQRTDLKYYPSAKELPTAV